MKAIRQGGISLARAKQKHNHALCRVPFRKKNKINFGGMKFCFIFVLN
jgi:hypothetical protein